MKHSDIEMYYLQHILFIILNAYNWKLLVT